MTRSYRGSVFTYTLTGDGKKLKRRLNNIIEYVKPKKLTLIICTALMLAGVLAFGLMGYGQNTSTEGGGSAAAPLQDSSYDESDGTQNVTGVIHEEQGSTDQTLTISYLWDYNITELVDMYMQANPGVTIIANRFEDDDIWLYGSEMKAWLMDGTADDLLFNFHIDHWNSETNQYLADWFPIMQADPDFNEDDFYMNVFEATSIGGQLFSLPLAFTYDMIAANNNIPGLADTFSLHNTVTVDDLLRIYREIQSETPKFLLDNHDALLAVYWSIDKFLDIENGTANFDSPEFIELITEARNITNPEKDFMIFTRYAEYDIEAMTQDNYFMNFFPAALQFMIPYEDELPFSGHVPVTNHRGELLIYTNDYVSFVLNDSSSSETQALAWNFMKFMQDPANFETNPNIFPFMVPVYRPLLQFLLELRVGFQFDPYHEMFNLLDRQSTLSTEKAVDHVFEILDQINQMPMSNLYIYYSTIEVATILHDYLTQFHEGQLTAEQTASELQSQISLALMD